MKNQWESEWENDELLVVEGEEINTLYLYLEKYIIDTYKEIAEKNLQEIDLIQHLIFDLSRPVQFLWYLKNYIKNYEEKIKKQERCDGYLVDFSFDDLEMFGKIIAQYDQEEKLTAFVKRSEKLLYFIQNFKASQGR